MRSAALILAGLACLSFGGVARASDLLRPTLMPSELQAVTDGLYLRVDAGVGFNRNPGLSTLPNPVGTIAKSLVDPNYTGTYSRSVYSPVNLRESGFGSVGIGFRVAPWLRFDVTGEYRGGAQLSATNVLNDVGVTGSAGTTAAGNTTVSNFHGHLSSAVFMANGYVDIGKYWGFVPFLGAGVGVASNHTSVVTEDGSYTAQSAGSGSFTIPISAFFPQRSKTNFAWSVMAGLAYDISPNLQLEAGYRLLNMGAFETGTEHAYTPSGIVQLPYFGRGRDFVANDVKIGLRWNFSATTPPAPLISRY